MHEQSSARAYLRPNVNYFRDAEENTLPDRFSRTQLLLGEDAMEKLSRSHVAVFGIGGVGGYATEALGCFLEHIMPAKNITKVSGICLSENIASCRVLEKCGFEKVYEGLGQYQGQERQIVKYVYCIS